jgi:hypothetical protein
MSLGWLNNIEIRSVQQFKNVVRIMTLQRSSHTTMTLAGIHTPHCTDERTDNREIFTHQQ